jgi:hypothetical protein
MKLNPFDHLLDEGTYNSGRLLVSSFWDRFKDTYRVFNGTDKDKNDPETYLYKMGILDYIFPLPMLLAGISLSMISSATEDMKQRENLSYASRIFSMVNIDVNDADIKKPSLVSIALRMVVGLILAIPFFFLSVSKALVSLALTVASLPFIATAHLYFKVKERKKDTELSLAEKEKFDMLLFLAKKEKVDTLGNKAVNLMVEVVPEDKSYDKGSSYTTSSVMESREEKNFGDLIEDLDRKNPNVIYKIKPYVLKSDNGASGIWGKLTSNRTYSVYSACAATRSLALVESVKGDKGKERRVVAHIHLNREENKAGIESLIESNLFRTKKGLEKVSSVDAFKKICGIKNK